MGSAVASLVYVLWAALVFLRSGPQTPGFGLGSSFLFSSFFWIAGGFAPMLLVMIVPWILVVLAYRKLRPKLKWSGQLYFLGFGAFLVFFLGCTCASLAPTPLFVDDQTFLQGATIAAERQGIAFLLAGLAFGACYWFFGERRVSAKQ